MARRRVFKTQVACPAVDPGMRGAFVGQTVALQNSPEGQVLVVVEGKVIGHLDTVVGTQVASAIKRGQSFTGIVQRAYQTEPSAHAVTWIEVKVEYLLDRGQLAIEASRPSAPEAPEDKPEPRSFFTKIAGVTFRNPDGSSRQRIIRECRVGEALLLTREPDNPVDKFAVAVRRINGQQLGYLGQQITREGHSSGLAWNMDRGDRYLCRISSITGGGPGRSHGVNIEIREARPGEAWAGRRASDAGVQTDAAPISIQLLILLAIVALAILVVVMSHR